MENEHINYIEKCLFENLISPEIAKKSLEVFKYLNKKYKLAVPAACTGPDGQMFYCWDNNEHHLEIEFSNDEPIYFFYRNRINNELFGDDYKEPLTEEMTEKV